MTSTNPVIAYRDELYACLLTAIGNYAAAEPTWIQPKQVCILPGDVIAEDMGANTDYCCYNSDNTKMGTAYVRLVSIYPSSQDPFPAQDSVATVCGPLSWGVRYEVGFMRCAPTGGSEVVDCADWINTDTLMAGDAMVMTQALCCMRLSLNPTFLSLIGSWLPAGPTGGCIRASIPIDAEITMCFNC